MHLQSLNHEVVVLGSVDILENGVILVIFGCTLIIFFGEVSDDVRRGLGVCGFFQEAWHHGPMCGALVINILTQ
jgi:hypothetical protein